MQLRTFWHILPLYSNKTLFIEQKVKCYSLGQTLKPYFLEQKAKSYSLKRKFKKIFSSIKCKNLEPYS